MHNPYKSAIEACVSCAQECERYAAEFAGSIGTAVRFCIDTAELCWAGAALMSRRSQIIPEMCQLCARACQVCAAECDKGPDEQLSHCAEACRECAEACLRIAEEGPPAQIAVQGSAVSASVSAAL